MKIYFKDKIIINKKEFSLIEIEDTGLGDSYINFVYEGNTIIVPIGNIRNIEVSNLEFKNNEFLNSTEFIKN